MLKIVLSSVAIGVLAFTILSNRNTVIAAEAETLRPRVDALVRPYLENKIVVGLTIGVLHSDKREVFGYGRMSRDDQRSPDGDTIYELGSVTKVLTGVLLADAVVDGQVKLDQPAGELLPAGVKMPANGDHAITLQHLSTHVSGLPRLPDNMKFSDPNNPYVDYREEDLYAFLNNHKLAHAPGTNSEYSNLGQGLLGHLLALRAKSTYEALLQNQITVPLKMTNTKIAVDKASQSRFAPGHTEDLQPAANWDLPVLAGAGGVRTTVNDMLLFAAANIAPPKDELGKAIELAWTVHQKPTIDGETSLGLGWQVAPDGTRWHNGQTGGYHSMVLINRKSGVGLVLMTNTATDEVDRLAIDTFRMMSGADVEPRKFEKPVEVPAEALQKFVGTYELTPEAVFTVEAIDGKLMIHHEGQPSYQVYPHSEIIWYCKVVDATIVFNVDESGKCNLLILSQNGIKQTAKRKE